MNTRLLQLTIIMLVITLLSGCTEPDPIQNGQFVYPAKSRIAKNQRSAGNQIPPMPAFDGVYPDRWPTEFKFPSETYAYYSLKLEPVSSPAASQMIRFRCVSKGSPNEILDYFRQEFQAAGMSLSHDNASGPIMGSPGVHDLSVENFSGAGVTYALLKVTMDDDLGGYTQYGGHFQFR